jgi:hypothetical protein
VARLKDLQAWLSARPRRAALSATLVLLVALCGLVSVRGPLLSITGLGGDDLGANGTRGTPTPPPPLAPIPYSHSWYVDDPTKVTWMGATDGAWLSQQSGQYGCGADFLTVLDFGHPTRKFTGHASPMDDYAMTIFGLRNDWRTYREVDQLAKQYLDAWMGAAGNCPKLHLVLGTNNFNECGKAVGVCDLGTAGRYWDIVVHDVAAYVSAKHYDQQVLAVWLGDDLEGGWDPWPTTLRFLEGVRDQELAYPTHARLVDYGDANAGACSEVTQECSGAWSVQNVYQAAWGLGWNVPLPEAYTAGTIQRWQDVQTLVGAMDPMTFVGLMTECGGTDPLPTGRCDASDLSQGGPAQCQLSPALARDRVQAADPRQQLAYATNIQFSSQHQDNPKHAQCA